MLTFEDVQRAAAHAGLKPLADYDPARFERAKVFAMKVILIIEKHCADTRSAGLALVAAAYDADAEIIAHDER